MQITAKQIIELALKYVGYKEKASNKDLYSFNDNAGKGNYTMFQHELDAARFWNNAKQGYEWCTSFVAWVFWRMLGNSEAKRILCLTGDYGAGCVSWVRYYKQAGRFFDSPKVGDQFFKKGSDGQPCHTGIVTSVDELTFTTVEGNAGNMVDTRRYMKNGSNVYGFGRPYYAEAAAEGKALTNDGGITIWNCIAVDSADGWTEIDAPSEDEDTNEADYKTSLAELGIS